MSNTTSSGGPLEHAQWGAPPQHLPDGKGGTFRSQLVIFRSLERTEKINWWHGLEPRRDPHSHPWSFESTILAGGYTEQRWEIDDKLDVGYIGEFTYKVGDVVRVPHGQFHLVTAVEPGTVTHMRCGPVKMGGRWHYMTGHNRNPNAPDGVFRQVTLEDPAGDPNYIENLRAINPYLRPAG